MGKLEKSQYFGKVDNPELYYDNHSTDNEDISKALHVLYKEEQVEHIQRAINENDAGVFKFFNPEMSVRRIDIVSDCYKLGTEYAEQLNSYSLSDEQAEAALYAYQHDFNMTEQLAAGESPDNVKLITDAVNTPGFILMDYFDESGSFLNYDKIKQFLKK